MQKQIRSLARKTKKVRSPTQPVIDFLKNIVSLYHLSNIHRSTISNFEEMLNAATEARKLMSENKTIKIEELSKPQIESNEVRLKIVRSEIASNYYTINSSVMILTYSLLEYAVSDFVCLYFEQSKIESLPPLQPFKTDIKEFAMLSKLQQRNFLAEVYINQSSEGIKYGFKRFESVLKPILGPSTISISSQTEIFKFSQLRNLLIHKNGIIDKQYLELTKLPRKLINSKINLVDEVTRPMMEAIIDYSGDIINRIKIKMGAKPQSESKATE
jgi:hypothetical protein